MGRYLEAHRVDLPAGAPQFVEKGHCLWCNKELTGKATKYCRPTEEWKKRYQLNYGEPVISECGLYFQNWWYSRPVYQRAILIQDNFICQKCGFHHMREDRPWLPDLSKLHVDHIIPISKVGFTEMTNLQTLCDKCNLKKGVKVEGEETLGIPSYKLRRDGYPPGKCPECGYESYYLIEWQSEEGYDPHMRKCQCRCCNNIYYLAPIFYQEKLL